MPPSMLPPPSSNTYSNQIGRGGTESHVRLDDQGTLQETGTRRGGNIFSRAWSSITRGKDEIQANKTTALGLVAEIREKYGSEIARMVAHDELSGQLSHGRPLSKRRIEIVLDQAQMMSREIQGINQRFLDENLDGLTDRALKAYEHTNTANIDRATAKEIIRQAILKSDGFNQRYYNHPLNYILSNNFGGDNGDVQASQDFFNDFKAVSQKALDHEVMSRILPRTTDVLDQQGFGIGDHQIESNRLREHIQSNMPALNDQDRALQEDLGVAETIIRFSAKDLVMDSESVSSGSAFRYAGMMDGLSNAIKTLDKIDQHALSDTDKTYLNAMREDARHMLGILSERLGLEGLEPGQVHALLVLTRNVGDLDESIYNARRMSPEQCETLGEALRRDLETLRAVRPGNESGRIVLDALIAKAELALAMTRHYQTALVNGLTPQDILQLHVDGVLEQGMRVFGDGGFGAREVAYLRANEVSFTDVARQFEPREIHLLREQGTSIGVALAIKARGIPIDTDALSLTVDRMDPAAFKRLMAYMAPDAKEDFARHYQEDIEGMQDRVRHIYGDTNYHLEAGPFDVTETDFGHQVTTLMNGTPEQREEGRMLLNTMPCAFQEGRVVQLFRLWDLPTVNEYESVSTR